MFTSAEAASARLFELRTNQAKRITEPKTPEEYLRDKQEILALKPQNVLVVCYAGIFRSGQVTSVLQERGYNAVNIGVTSGKVSDLNPADLDAVIVMTPKIKSDLDRLYGDDLAQLPTRVIGIAESSGFHSTSEADKEALAQEIGAKLDELGFVEKTPHSA